MENTSSLVGRGLWTVFWGQMLSVACRVLVFLPGTLRIIGVLVSLILHIVGLYIAGKCHKGYRNAFNAAVGSLPLGMLKVGVGSGFLGLVLTLAIAGAALAEIYFVCNTSSILLRAKNWEQAKKGEYTWKLYRCCTILALVCAVLIIIPGLNVLGGFLTVAASIMGLAAALSYLFFLPTAAHILCA